MDKALHLFMNSFGINAYPSTSVPAGAAFPYMTYEPYIGGWGDVAQTAVNLWYYGESEATPNEKALQISDAIGSGGAIVPCNEGALWITRANPFCQSIRDDADPLIKRRYLLVNIQFLT